jgi:glycosyltransferase involved in cell wall biosynthesis
MKVAIVNGICVDRDGISNSIRADVEALKSAGHDVRFFGYSCTSSNIPFVRVKSSYELLLNSFYMYADAIIYHFGIYYELFNSATLGSGIAPIAVRFHNITPLELVAAADRPIIEKSQRQAYNMLLCDEVWPVSVQNCRDALALGVAEERIRVVPMAACLRPAVPAKGPGIRLLFVGRFVAAKGILDLLSATIPLVKRRVIDHVVLMGSQDFSDPQLVTAARTAIGNSEVPTCFTLKFDASDVERDAEYAKADLLVVPSYHEGFCLPVIEAMHFGCLPITYDAYNLAFVAEGLSIAVRTGDVAALRRGIERAAGALRAAKGGAEAGIEVDLGTFSLAEYRERQQRVVATYASVNTSSVLVRALASLAARGRRVTSIVDI